MKRIPIFFLTLLAVGICQAVEIKGLTLGRIYDAQALANIFGNAQCPKPEAVALSNARGFDTIICDVPISYLGLKTSATIYLSGNWMARSISIDIPASRLADVEALLISKYDKPALERGDFEKMVPGLNPGDPEQPLIARCTKWPKVQDAQIKLCEKPILPVGGPYVEYAISKQVELDATDI